ncbi:MAG: hypothetical protein K6G10_03730 [Butyrivibrio sp.]|nr:hypothetical protein [Butyrivibrio sp.]
MKLKYYLRGMGIGIILTAIVMGFALGGRKATLSDAEIIKRAKALGMTEAGAEVLTDHVGEEVDKNEEESSPSSDQALDEAGAEISEEINREFASADQTVQELAETQEETAGEKQEDSSSEVDVSKETAKQEVNEADNKTEVAKEEQKEPVKAEEPSKKEEEAAEVPKTTETTENTGDTAQSSDSSFTTGSQKTVTIPGGLSSDGVASILYGEGIVDNAVSFNRYLIDRGIDRIIRSGVKVIPAGSTYEQIAEIITK